MRSRLIAIPPWYVNPTLMLLECLTTFASLSSDIYQSCFHVARDAASCSLFLMRSYTHGAPSKITKLSIIRTAHILPEDDYQSPGLGTFVRNRLSFRTSKDRLTVTDDDNNTILEGALVNKLFKLRLSKSDDSRAREIAKAMRKVYPIRSPKNGMRP